MTYKDLSIVEKREFTGELLHAIANNEQIFHWAQELIEAAKYAGIIKNVVINPTPCKYEECLEGVSY